MYENWKPFEIERVEIERDHLSKFSTDAKLMPYSPDIYDI